MLQFLLFLAAVAPLTFAMAACAPAQKTPSPLFLLHQQADETRQWFAANPPDGTNLEQRRQHMSILQTYADALPPEIYQRWHKAAIDAPRLADKLEEHPALHYLSRATDAAFADIRSTTVTRGVAVWHIYNMGYVFKTPTACFAIDLKARDAARLADTLDFLLITHLHSDHVSEDLIAAMHTRKKPVVTTRDFPDVAALPDVSFSAAATNPSTLPANPMLPRRQLKFGELTVKIDIGDHHNRPPYWNTMLMYQVDCGPAAGNATIYHSGDGCNLKKMNPDRAVDLFMFHVAVGLNPQQAIEALQPKLSLVSHVMELAHSPKPPHAWRWSFDYALEKVSKVPQEKTALLTWGERYLLPGTQLAK